MSFNKKTIEMLCEWLKSDYDAAAENDPDVGIFRDDELMNLISHVQANIEDWLDRDRRQERVLDWVKASFGQSALNRDERAARLVEEAVEVAQCEGVLLEAMQRIVSRVYSRPPGHISREIGGVAITLDALAQNLGRSVDNDASRELERVLSMPAEHWRAKHAEKVAAGTANLSTPPDETPPEPWCELCGAGSCEHINGVSVP